MKKEHKEKWLRALRSGEYCQTQGVLVNAAGYCCLGVLAEECGDPKLWERDDRGHWLYDNRISMIGPDWVLLSERIESLVDMNDSQNKSFYEIADWIELNVKVAS